MRRQRLDISIAFLLGIAMHCLAPGHAARADRGEASLHAQVHYGRAIVGEPDAPGDTDDAPFAGAGARITYAISNWYAFEASLGYGRLGRQAVHTIDVAAGDVQRSWHQAWVQAELGITARFGVRVIPTLHAALGVQRRTWQGGRRVEDTVRGCNPLDRPMLKPCAHELHDRATLELVGTLGGGLDYRLGDHWIVGMSVTAEHAALTEAPFHTVAATFHFSYYFYPEGAGP